MRRAHGIQLAFLKLAPTRNLVYGGNIKHGPTTLGKDPRNNCCRTSHSDLTRDHFYDRLATNHRTARARLDRSKVSINSRTSPARQVPGAFGDGLCGLPFRP